MSTQDRIQRLIDAWKAAEKAAALAEKDVTEATLRYAQGLGPRPRDDVVGDARMLRSLAKELLDRALSMMDTAVKADKREPGT
jgi:hypothetical protein